MVSRIHILVASFVIFLAVSLAVFSAMRFVADMQTQVTRVAWANKDIITAYHYTEKALAWNPTEARYYRYRNRIRERYNHIQESLRRARGGK